MEDDRKFSHEEINDMLALVRQPGWAVLATVVAQQVDRRKELLATGTTLGEPEMRLIQGEISGCRLLTGIVERFSKHRETNQKMETKRGTTSSTTTD